MFKIYAPAKFLLAVFVASAVATVSFAAPTLAAKVTENLIVNADLSQSNNGNPIGWNVDRWLGTEADFSNNGGDQPFLGVTINRASGGDAKWYFDEVNVVPGKIYKYSDQYRANVRSFITARFKMDDGSYTYSGIKTLKKSNDWRNANAKIKVPAGASAMSVFHLIQKPGTLETSIFSLRGPQAGTESAPTSTPGTTTPPVSDETTTPPIPATDSDISRGGFVSINFDDGELSAYEKAVPILNEAGFRGTFYIASKQLAPDYSGYVNVDQVKNLRAKGHEIGAHSRIHSHILGASSATIEDEIKGSKTDLESFGVGPIDTFAYTYGEFNDAVVQAVKDAGFLGARSTQGGINTAQSDRFGISARSLTRTDTFDDIRKDIDKALSEKGWFILTFHRIDHPSDKYSNSSALVEQIVDYLKDNNIPVATVAEGIRQFVK